jgi:GxxExxY protein
MEYNEVSYSIRGAIYEVYKTLGPGLLESIYEAALEYELIQNGLFVKRQVEIPVNYKDTELGLGFRADLLVENMVIVEVKSIESLKNVHKKQLLTYLKISNKKLGILVNFNTDNILGKDSLIRIIN